MRIIIEPIPHRSLEEERVWQVVFSWPSKQKWFYTKKEAVEFARNINDYERSIVTPGEKAAIYNYPKKDAIIFNGKILGHKNAENYPLHE